MTGFHKGLASALARAWACDRSVRTGEWLVEAFHGADPCEDWQGGAVVFIRHCGTTIGLVARGTLVATATSASDRDGMNSVIRMLVPQLCMRMSMKGGCVDSVDDDPRAVACALRERPGPVEDMAEGLGTLMVCQPGKAFDEAVADLMRWKGAQTVFADGRLLWVSA